MAKRSTPHTEYPQRIPGLRYYRREAQSPARRGSYPPPPFKAFPIWHWPNLFGGCAGITTKVGAKVLPLEVTL